MTEGVLLSIVGGALGLVLARVGVQALIRAYPTSLPRTSEVAVDPIVLLFTLGVSMLTGLVFGLAPIMHTRVKGLATALKEGGAKRRHRRGAASRAARPRDGRSRAGRDARDRRRPAAAHGLQPRDGRRRLRSLAAGDVLDDAARRRTIRRRRRARSSISACSSKLRARARRPGGDRDVGAAAESSARTPTTPTSTTTPRRPRVRSRTSTTTRTSCPTTSRRWASRSSQGRGVPAERRRVARPGGGRQRDAGEHVLEGPEPDRPAPAAALRRSTRRGSRSSASRRTSSRAASIKKTGTEFYFLVDQTAHHAAAVRQCAGHDEHRAAHDAAAGDACARRSRAPCATPIPRFRSCACAT